MIVFQNPGLIDLVTVEAFGVSVKATSTPFGQFGTGLKYAIATILRNGGNFTLWRGNKPYEFTTRPHQVRGVEKQFVHMGSKRLPYTTEFGRNWEPWQAFRELWANCMDEGGTVWHVDDNGDELLAVPPDTTTIVWSGLDAEKAWAERNSVLLSSEPVSKLDGVDVHAGESDFIYYKGVRVYKLPKPALFTYNLTSYQHLTEERLLSFFFLVPKQMATAMLQCSDPEIIKKVLSASGGYFEGIFEWHEVEENGEKPADTFVQVSLELFNAGKLAGNAIKLFKKFEERYHHYGYSDPQVVRLSPVEQAVVDEALTMFNSKGIPHGSYTVGAKSGFDEGQKFEINKWHRTIYINVELLTKGPAAVAVALVEAIAFVAWNKRNDIAFGDRHQLAYFIINGKFEEWPEEPVHQPDEVELMIGGMVPPLTI